MINLFKSMKKYIINSLRAPTAGFLALLFFSIFTLFLIFSIIKWAGNTRIDLAKSHISLILEVGDFENSLELILEYLKENPDDENGIKKLLETGATYYTEHPEIPKTMVESFLSKVHNATQIKPLYLKAWYLYYSENEIKSIELIQSSPNVSAYDLTIGAEIAFEAENYNEVVSLINTIPDDQMTKQTRYLYLYSLIETGELEQTETLLDQKEYASLCGEHCYRELYLKQKKYLKMIPYLIAAEWGSYTPGPVAATLIPGLGWLFFILHLGGWRFWGKKEKLLPLAALPLGILSTLVTVFVVLIQDAAFGIGKEGQWDTVTSLIYFIVGVGAREELIKLLFFFPVALFLVNQKEDLVIIALASLVGLGFAIEENIHYYNQYGGAVVLTRFVTANFFHMTMTGFCGYFLVRALKYGEDEWGVLIFQTVKMIVVHGLYDFFLTSIDEGEFFAMFVYIYISREYLQLFLSANHYNRFLALPVSFIIALALSVGMTYFVSAGYSGLTGAFYVLASSLLGVAIIIYMFFYELKDQIHMKK